MIDMFNLSTPYLNTQVFTASTAQWQTWIKPANAKMVYFFVVGGGGGGGGGRTVNLNSSPGGGGGGGSSITTGTYIASMLPDTLYLQIGLGGAGGVANTAGSAGTLSYVSYRPDTTAINILLQSGNSGASAGTGSFSTTGVGAGGAGGVAWTWSTAINGSLGIVDSTTGQNGTSGTGLGATPNNVTPSLPITGGAGGGAVSAGAVGYNGGSILGTGFLNTLLPGVTNAADVSINGNNGYNTLSIPTIPDFFTGGAGGGSATTTGRAGGTGGNGSYGSGGGGGGGTYSGTGGSGGKGGDGIIIIVCS